MLSGISVNESLFSRFKNQLIFFWRCGEEVVNTISFKHKSPLFLVDLKQINARNCWPLPPNKKNCGKKIVGKR